jgi:thioesterase domain-containing protein
MAAQYLAAIRTVQATGPYYLGGFCLGGMLAFEIAQQLTAAGEDVGLVAMIENPTGVYGRPLPHITPLQRMAHRARQRLELELTNFAPLEPRARVAHGLQRANRLLTLGLVRVETAADPLLVRTRPSRRPSRARVLEALTEAHARALEAYVPRPYAGRVVVIRASQQPWGIIPDPAMGWSGLIQDGLEMYEIPGQHKNILKEPRVRLLAERLSACLASATRTFTILQPALAANSLLV